MFDKTYELADRPYQVRDFTISEYEVLEEMANRMSGAQLMRAQLLFLLRGPDGEPPDEDVLGEFSFGDYCEVIMSVFGMGSK